jgi:hypothetical protein
VTSVGGTPPFLPSRRPPLSLRRGVDPVRQCEHPRIECCQKPVEEQRRCTSGELRKGKPAADPLRGDEIRALREHSASEGGG